jgi:hypothetical protein
MLCEKCSSQIILGKGSNDKEKWCPTCEGFEVLSKEESRRHYNELIKETGQELKRLRNTFEVNSLIITLLVTREGFLLPTLKGFGFDSFGYVALTDLISKILIKGSKGTKECNCLDSDFQELIHLAKSHYEDLRILLLINKDLASVVRVPPSSLRSASFEYEVFEQMYGKFNPEDLDPDLVEIVKFNDKWENIRDNLYENGFVSSNEAYKNQVENKKFDHIFEEYFEAIQTKISFELAMQDDKLFSQDKFENSFEYVDLLDVIGDIFYSNLEIKKQAPLEFECSLRPVSKGNFDNIIKTLGYDVSRTYDLLVFTKDKKTTFPLIYEYGEELLIPPITLKLFKKLLNALYSQELMDKLSKDGHSFEKKVCASLENIGLNVSQPNDCTKKLINIVDNIDIKKRTLEIDIVAYNYHTNKLFVIDCKNILFTSSFIFGDREEKIYEKLAEQPEKQEKRIEYMKNNLALFGLSSKKVKKYISVLITANKEPINVLGNCHIISLREIEKIKDLEPI